MIYSDEIFPRAREQILKYRQPVVGRLDMHTVTARLDIRLEIIPHHCLGSLYWNLGGHAGWTMRIDAKQDHIERLFTFAHEIAHIVLSRSGVRRPQSSEEYWKLERGVDRLARELLIPYEWLTDETLLDLEETEEGLLVSRKTLLLQLAAAKHYPDLMRSNGEVLCVRCGGEAPPKAGGDYWHHEQCQCLAFRDNPNSILPEPLPPSMPGQFVLFSL